MNIRTQALRSWGSATKDTIVRGKDNQIKAPDGGESVGALRGGGRRSRREARRERIFAI